MTEVSVVFVTVGGEEEARGISRALVGEKLVACVGMLPGLRSIYWWKGEVRDDAEWLLIMKTRTALVPALQERIVSLHGYEVPEIIAFPVEQGLPAYLDWVAESTTDHGSS
ncbi:MAG: divalent-cation tolerance protein CutA [Syntrophobacteraceae bacterium]|jgi:periplasmic divalent cation tolerance protein|nr:divalent-cation tolerance protein CutA [Syntrophobacteraceae bacterium]